MESTIILLDEKTDQATKQMLQNVVDRKKKFEALKKKHLQSLWATMIVAALFMIYLYFYIVVPYSYSFFSMFSVFVDHFSHFLFLASAIGLYGYMVLIKKSLIKLKRSFNCYAVKSLIKVSNCGKKRKNGKAAIRYLK